MLPGRAPLNARPAGFLERPNMAQLPKGATFAIATGFGPSIVVSDISNAAEGVVTSASHGLADGDIIELTTGWTKLNRRIFKVDQLSATTFGLVSIDTLSTASFPPGSSARSFRKITAWTQVPKVMNPNTSGGDPKPVTYEFLEDENEYQINNGFSATGYTIEIDDDIETPGYAAVLKASDEQAETALRILMKGNKNPTYMPCYVAMNPIPVLQEGQINRLRVSFNGRARPTRYSGTVA